MVEGGPLGKEKGLGRVIAKNKNPAQTQGNFTHSEATGSAVSFTHRSKALWLQDTGGIY